MIYPYTFDKQFEKYIGQFMRVFSGFQTKDGVVRNGVNEPRRVPVVYGNMSRVVADVLNKRDYLNNNMIPMMAVNMAGIQPDNERKRSSSHRDVVPVDSTTGTHKVALERLIGPPFIMNMQVSIYASSMTEMFSILEQILLIFNPRLSIQVDNKVENSDYITEIFLKSIDPEFQHPMGTNKELVMLTLNFDVPIRLRYPYKVDDGLINSIVLQIFESSRNGFDTKIEDVILNGEDNVNP